MKLKQLKDLLNKYPDDFNIELNSLDSKPFEIIQISQSDDAAHPDWLYINFDMKGA